MSKITPNSSGASKASKPNDTTPEQRNGQNFQSYLSAVDKYILEWSDLSTVCEDHSLACLRQIAIAGHLKVSKFRSVSWAILLDVLEGNATAWMNQRKADRTLYEQTKAKHSANPRNDKNETMSNSTINVSDDPLSQSQESVWNQHFCDQELFGVIRQDVVRTFPGVDFYRRPAIQELMVNVLFCYAREHPSMCYRQGMHEILAPVLFVMHCDQQTFMHIKEVCGEQPVEQTMSEVLDPKYMEADSYFIFVKIMDAIESFYHIKDMQPSATGYFPPSKHGDDGKRSKLEVVGQLNVIRDRILAVVDPQLHSHLLKMDIPLTLFGIRWLRLLFGREFSLPDLLVVWDSIFATDSHFELTNYIVVAMLTQIRTTLLTSDYTTCLTHLMKYPSNVDVSQIIRYAMHIKMPDTYECPPGAFVKSKTAPSPRPVSHPKPVPPERERVEQPSHRRAYSHDERNIPQRVRSGSFVQKKTIDEQNAAAMAAMRINPEAPGEHDPSIVEGFREDSPELLRIELDRARAIMSLTRLKLTQYLTIMRQNIPGNSMDVVHQTMDGIEELCSLLQVKHEPSYSAALPVERAFEVNEPPVGDEIRSPTLNSPQTQHKSLPKSTHLATPSVQPSATRRIHRRSEGEDARRSFVQQLRRADDHNEFEVAVSEAGIIDALAYDEIVYTTADAEQAQQGAVVSLGARYEIPDDGRLMSRMASKILGDRKEVEMHEFNPRLVRAENVEPLRLAVGSAMNGTDQRPVVDPSLERDSPDP